MPVRWCEAGPVGALPTAVFAVRGLISIVGLGWAVKPIGPSAVLTVGYAMLSGDESVSVAKLVFITGIVAAVAGAQAGPGRPVCSSASKGKGR